MQHTYLRNTLNTAKTVPRPRTSAANTPPAPIDANWSRKLFTYSGWYHQYSSVPRPFQRAQRPPCTALLASERQHLSPLTLAPCPGLTPGALRGGGGSFWETDLRRSTLRIPLHTTTTRFPRTSGRTTGLVDHATLFDSRGNHTAISGVTLDSRTASCSAWPIHPLLATSLPAPPQNRPLFEEHHPGGPDCRRCGHSAAFLGREVQASCLVKGSSDPSPRNSPGPIATPRRRDEGAIVETCLE